MKLGAVYPQTELGGDPAAVGGGFTEPSFKRGAKLAELRQCMKKE